MCSERATEESFAAWLNLRAAIAAHVTEQSMQILCIELATCKGTSKLACVLVQPDGWVRGERGGLRGDPAK